MPNMSTLPSPTNQRPPRGRRHPLPSRVPRAAYRRMLGLWLLAVAVASAASWWWSGRVAHSYLQDQLVIERQAALVEASLVAGHITQRMSQVAGVPRAMAQDPGIVQAVQRYCDVAAYAALPLADKQACWAADPQLAALMHRLARQVSVFNLKVLWAANARGDVVAEARASDMPAVLGLNVSDRDYFQAAQQGRDGHQFAVGRLSNNMALFFSSPVVVDGAFAGAVGANLNLDEFSPLMQGVHALLTDEFEVVVLASNPAWVMRALPQAAVFEQAQPLVEARYKRATFERLALDEQPPLAGQTMVTLAGVSGPLLTASRPVGAGLLQLHTFRSPDRTIAATQVGRLSRFMAIAALAALVLGLLAGASLFAEVSRRQNRALYRLNARLSRLANTDALTGATSRRQYLKLLALELARSNRHGMQLCVLSLDLDHFKRVNDTYGHAAGDAVLRHFAQVVRTQLRQSDVLGRLGGEEFSVLLSQTTTQGGLQMAQRLQAAVAGSMVVFEGEPIAVTVSIGGVHWSVGQAVAVDHLLAAADEALYRAKREGRNRVVWYGDPDPASDGPT